MPVSTTGTYTQHTVIKPEKIVATQLGLLSKASVLAKVAFVRQGIDAYKDAQNDTVSMKVPGRLPARRYAFRNDRTNEIEFDVYAERKVTMTLGDHLYSAVRITDEQVDFDGVNANGLMPIQAAAVAAALEDLCRTTIEGAPFPVVIGGVASNLRKGVLEARKVLNKLRQPDTNRLLVVGSNFENSLLLNKDITFASSSGDNVAEGALRNAYVGQLYGFDVVRDDSIDADAAYAMSGNAFVLSTGAPTVPQSAPFGASATFDGFGLTWVRSYALKTLEDQSVVHTWAGTTPVTDVFLNYKKPQPTGNPVGGEVVGTSEHFVRAIKLNLGGTTSTGPTAGSALALDAGLAQADVWAGTGVAPA